MGHFFIPNSPCRPQNKQRLHSFSSTGVLRKWCSKCPSEPRGRAWARFLPSVVMITASVVMYFWTSSGSICKHSCIYGFPLGRCHLFNRRTEMLPEVRVKSQWSFCDSSALWSDATGSVSIIWLTSKGWHSVRLVQSAAQTCHLTVLDVHGRMNSATWTKWLCYTAVFLTILDLICAFFTGFVCSFYVFSLLYFFIHWEKI